MKSSIENVTCDNCTHRAVCGKRDYMEAMIHDIRGIAAYSKYNDFKVFIECEYGTFDKNAGKTNVKSKEVIVDDDEYLDDDDIVG